MVRDLEVPFALAGLEIHAHQRVAEQVVARTVAAVEVRRRILDGQVREAGLFVHRDLRPDAGVAVDRPRLVLPRIVAELPRTRNRVERPQQLAALHVERAHEAFRVVVRLDRHPLFERGADDDDVLDDGGRRVEADLAGLQIDLLSLAEHGALLQIDDAAFAERLDHRSVLGVQRDEAIAGRHVEDALVALAVGPVRHAAARELPRRNRGAVAFTVAVRPDQLAGAAVEGDNRSPRAGRRVEHAANRERRALELELRTRAEVVGLEAPRHFHLVEVRRGDLIERHVLRAADVGGVVRPVAVLRAREAGGLSGRPRGHPKRGDAEHGDGRRRALECLHHVCS